jgi:large subunit ribosomal protein L22
MEVKAIAKYLRVSPRKANLVAKSIRGKKVDHALSSLKFVPKKSAVIMGMVLKSAIANAEQNPNIDVDTLFIKEVSVNQGPTLKRFRPKAMGRAGRILKRTSHIKIVLDER